MSSGKPGKDKAFVFAVLFSLITILTGMAWTWRVGQDSNMAAHEWGHLEDGLKDLRKMVAHKEVKR